MMCAKKRNNRVNFMTVIVLFCLALQQYVQFTQLLSPILKHEKIFSHLHTWKETCGEKKVDIKNTISNLHKRFFGFFFFIYDRRCNVMCLFLLFVQTNNQQNTHYFSSYAINCSLQSSSGACINSSDCQQKYNDNLVILKVFSSRTWEIYPKVHTHIADDCERTRVA